METEEVGSVVLPEDGSIRRIRFDAFSLDVTAGGACRARVQLSWPGGSTHEGEQEGVDSSTGRLRCAAEATALALRRAMDGKVDLELLGVKAIKSFDAIVVVVSLASQAEGESQRLVGSCILESNPERGAALAVLNATNRMVGNIIDHTTLSPDD